MRVLVVAAHPDDELLGCGGTVAQLVQEGNDVYITILGEGVTSRYQSREQADLTLVEEMHNRSCQVAEMLGVKDTFMHNLPDNRFDTVPLLDIVKIIEGLIANLAPEVIYTHHGGDLNIDHEVVHRAVLTATRSTQSQPVRRVLAFEIPSSTDWAFQQFEPSFRPNVFVDISNTLDLKMQALSVYQTELCIFPHPRSNEAIRAIACRWGSLVGCKAAEAFELIREVRLGGSSATY